MNKRYYKLMLLLAFLVFSCANNPYESYIAPPLVVTPINDGINIKWNSEIAISRYNLYRSHNTSARENLTLILSTAGDQRSYEVSDYDSNINPIHHYWYHLEAIKGTSSYWTIGFPVGPDGSFPIITNFKVWNMSTNSIFVTWNKPIQSIYYYITSISTDDIIYSNTVLFMQVYNYIHNSAVDTYTNLSSSSGPYYLKLKGYDSNNNQILEYGPIIGYTK